MGIVIGPYNRNDWHTMGQLRKDLIYTKDYLSKVIDPDVKRDYKISERHVRRVLRDYMRREVA